MLYLFLAPDEYLLGQRLGQLKQALGDAEMASLNLTELDGARVTAADIIYHLGAMPFLAARRLIIARGYLANLESRLGTAKSPNRAAQDEARQVLTCLADQPAGNDLVFVEEKLDKRRALWRGMDGTAGIEQLSRDGLLAVEDIATPDARQLPGWIAKNGPAGRDRDRGESSADAGGICRAGPALPAHGNRKTSHLCGRSQYHRRRRAALGKRFRRSAHLGSDRCHRSARWAQSYAGAVHVTAQRRQSVLSADDDHAPVPDNDKGEG